MDEHPKIDLDGIDWFILSAKVAGAPALLLSAGIFRGSSLCPLSPDFIDELCADYLLFSYLKQTRQQFVVQPNGSAQYY